MTNTVTNPADSTLSSPLASLTDAQIWASLDDMQAEQDRQMFAGFHFRTAGQCPLPAMFGTLQDEQQRRIDLSTATAASTAQTARQTPALTPALTAAQ